MVGAVALLLVSACVNAGNLLLSRGFARRRELAVKMALGATRGRLVRQLLTESLLISLGGAALGLLFAAWTNTVIPSLFSPDHAALLDTRLQSGLILATVAIACAAGGLFGVAPAFHATSSPPSLALRADSGSISEEQGGRTLRAVLVAAQVALSTVLHARSRTADHEPSRGPDADRTFPAENVALVVMENPGRFDDPLRGLAFQRTLVQTLRRQPASSPQGGRASRRSSRRRANEFRIAGRGRGSDRRRRARRQRRHQRILQGARCQAARRAAVRRSATRRSPSPVAIVDELLARRYFGRVAVGQHLVDLRRATGYEIVGVVRGGKFRTLQEAPHPTVYFRSPSATSRKATLFVVVRGDATPMVAALPGIIGGSTMVLAVKRVVRLDEHLAESLAIDRLTTTWWRCLWLLALVMAVDRRLRSDERCRAAPHARDRPARGARRGPHAGREAGVHRSRVRVGRRARAGTVLALVGGRIVGLFISGLPRWELTTLGAPPALLALIVGSGGGSPASSRAARQRGDGAEGGVVVRGCGGARGVRRVRRGPEGCGRAARPLAQCRSQLLDHVGRDFGGLHACRALPHADGRHGADGDDGFAAQDRELVFERARLHFGEPDEDVELLLEVQAVAELACGRQAWPADVAARLRDGEAGGAPERVLRLFHVAEHHREVDDAGEIGLGELDAPAVAEFAGGVISHQSSVVSQSSVIRHGSSAINDDR